MKLGILQQITRAMGKEDNADLQQLHQRMLQLGIDPNNLYQELEMTSRFVDTHRDISCSNAHMHLHSHTFYELIYCCNTCDAQYLVGSERYRLQQGDIIFVPPGVSHRPLLPENMMLPYERYVIWISQAFAEQFIQVFSNGFLEKQSHIGLLRTGEGQNGPLRLLFQAGIQEAEGRAEGWEAAVIGNALILFSQLKRATAGYKVHPLKAEKPQLLDKLTAYVEENYHHKITLRELSKRFFVSESTISHLCKEQLGVSFYRYVTQRRLIAAKSLIEKGSHLEQVAIETGFQDYSGFYRAFRQEYGISPRQYKNMQ